MTDETRDMTRILDAAASGDRRASEELLPLIYDELRRLAEAQIRREPGGGAGQTLQPTALVHEAYLRLIGDGDGTAPVWNSRGHFYGAAAQAMRRILVDRARGRGRVKRGGGREREPLDDAPAVLDVDAIDMMGLDEALSALEAENERTARVVMLRYFAGLSVEETAAAMGLGVTTVKAEWNYARAWLHRRMEGA